MTLLLQNDFFPSPSEIAKSPLTSPYFCVCLSGGGGDKNNVHGRHTHMCMRGTSNKLCVWVACMRMCLSHNVLYSASTFYVGLVNKVQDFLSCYFCGVCSQQY